VNAGPCPSAPDGYHDDPDEATLTGPGELAGRASGAGLESPAGLGGLAGAAAAGVLGRLTLARSTVDRAAERRTDTAWLDAAWAEPGSRVLVVDDGQALARFSGQGAELVFVPPREAPPGVRFLLGVDVAGVVYFGVLGQLPGADPAEETGGSPAAGPGTGRAAPAASARPDGARPDGLRPASLRSVGQLLGDRDAGLMTHAVALANWHAISMHCSRCGAVTEPGSAGHSRRCPVDGSEHFPRLDPAVIMLVTDPDDRCLLARNSRWPERRVSILAGFVEPGESVEQAVAREVLEETGIAVGQTWYLGSQPWPMPHSLMLGFRALAHGGQQIRVDTEEIAEASWYSREELRASVASGGLLLPPPVSIAHRIIESWYGEDLPGAW
jgi:NAD+ diphosphatase